MLERALYGVKNKLLFCVSFQSFNTDDKQGDKYLGIKSDESDHQQDGSDHEHQTF